MSIDKSVLGVAGEFAVASELCRRNMYAQLTFGHQKRMDLLVINEKTQRILRVEVKAKQGRDWPNCKGIGRNDSFLVFVDYEKKFNTERPDFYVLSVEDWREHCHTRINDYKTKHPDRRIELTDLNVIRWPDEVGSNGKPYEGTGVRAEDIREHKDAWHKLEAFATA